MYGLLIIVMGILKVTYKYIYRSIYVYIYGIYRYYIAFPHFSQYKSPRPVSNEAYKKSEKVRPISTSNPPFTLAYPTTENLS